MVTKNRDTSQASLDQVEHTDDVVEFTLRCVMALAPSLSAAVVASAEQHVRSVFGGDEVWVSKRRDLARRNESIMREYLAGERIAYLSRKHHISERHVIRIVKATG